MQSGIQNFKNVLNQRNIIPAYQRNYVWSTKDTEEVKIFWQDLINFCDRFKEKKVSSYLLGPIIIHNKDNESNYIVDGQQRITTAVILLSACKQICSELYKDQFGNILCRDANTFKDTEITTCIGTLADDPNDDELKLIVAPANRVFFRKYIIDEKHSCDDIDLSPAMVHMKEAYDFFYKQMREEIQDVSDDPKNQFKRLKELINLLLNNMEVFYVERNSFADAYSVFETINARGKTLTQADLFKNYIFASCNPDGKTDSPIEITWARIESKIDSKKITDYLRYFWISRHSNVSVANVFRTISSEMHDPEKIQEFVDALDKYAEVFAYYLNPFENKPFFSNCNKLEDSIKGLYVMGFEIYAPALLSMVQSNFTNDEMYAVLSKLECFAFRNVKICGKRTNKIWVKIVAQSKSIYDNTTIPHSALIRAFTSMVNEFLASDAEFNESLSKYDFTKNDFAKYVLKSLINNEEYGVNEDITLEHVLPQTPNFKKGQWLNFEYTLDSYAYKIGNMTLLTSDDNLSNSNSPYEIKRPVYNNSKLKMNQELATNDDWTAEVIRERTKVLEKEIQKRWPIISGGEVDLDLFN